MTLTHTSMADALFTKTQQRVLALIYGLSERSFYLNELVRLADIGKGAVTRELSKLTSAGILVMNKQGNQVHYQANSKSPIFIANELLVLVGELPPMQP